MRGVEHAAIEAGAASGRVLMERAGRGVLTRILAARPDMAAAPARALVLCGPGNNGGDGYVLARLLHDRGWQVRVHALAAPGDGAPDAAFNHELWRERGPVAALDGDGLAAVMAADAPALVIDAVFGTGLQRPLGAELAQALAEADGGDALCVAVDAPSGLCMDSGRPLVEGADALPLPADLTVTFHRAKPGHYLADGPASCGTLEVVGIGLAEAQVAGAARLAAPALGALGKAGGAHKYRHGHALVLSGGVARGGAARLAARAALRIGAGLVTLACPPAALIENAAQLDAVMLRPLADGAALSAMLEADLRFNALCLGPGLGLGARSRDLVAAALGSGRPAVLDADALSVFAEDPAALFAMLHGAVVLTPHDGEFARLFPDLAAPLQDRPARGPALSRLDAARAAASRAGAVVLLKGADTVIASPEGDAVINAAAYERAAPWLATAGSGDVLSGLIAGLSARGFAVFEAAQTAAWLHVEAARAFGPGLIAEDLPETLPRLLRELGF